MRGTYNIFRKGTLQNMIAYIRESIWDFSYSDFRLISLMQSAITILITIYDVA